MNTHTAHPNVSHPAGATDVDEWSNPDDYADTTLTLVGPATSRYFHGSSWVVERNDKDSDISIRIDGLQYADGRVERLIHITDGNTEVIVELTPALARQLGRKLFSAADECEKMNGYDQITT